MRRRDFTIGLLLAAATRTVPAQERAMQHRIAIVIPASPVASISETGIRAWQAFFEELRRLGDVGIRVRGGPKAMPISLARSSTGTPR